MESAVPLGRFSFRPPFVASINRSSSRPKTACGRVPGSTVCGTLAGSISSPKTAVLDSGIVKNGDTCPGIHRQFWRGRPAIASSGDSAGGVYHRRFCRCQLPRFPDSGTASNARLSSVGMVRSRLTQRCFFLLRAAGGIRQAPHI
jgi:hypothetical protein